MDIVFDKQADGIATITLNRPDKLNAFTHEMIDHWAAYVADAAKDPAVKVVVLRGTGRGFCVGADADEMSTRGRLEPLERRDFLWSHIHQIALNIERMDKPLIGSINGLARGAGCDMALMCDLRIASKSASFAWSYINLNLIAGDGGTYYLPRIIGMPRALELFWTGRAVAAEEADRIGLVNRVVADEDLDRETMSLAAAIAAQPSDAVRMYKRVAYQGENQSLYSHLDMIASHMATLRGSPENLRRIDQFREERRLAREKKGGQG
jgi:enoyl-CoA hydratase/carnithine racemase